MTRRRTKRFAPERRASVRVPFGGRVVLVAAAIACFVALTLPTGVVLSAYDTDIMGQFVAWRAFAAASIRAGDFPFWNPYTYAGQPFFTGFQSALLYPPNGVFLLLPIERAINLSLLLHLVWLGWGMALWVNQRGLHPAASALAGVLLPFSGPVFPQLYAGHLSNLCTMAWAPWVFLGLERAWLGSPRRGLLLASAAVGMQVLAGHVQYAFYTGIAAGLYATLPKGSGPPLRTRVLGVGLVYVAACALVAVQLGPGLAAASEGLRADKLPFSYVRLFSFPPENLLTAFAPWFFGTFALGPGAPVYWGRGFLWEMSLFVGASGTVLALAALEDRVRTGRRVAWHVMLPVTLFVLALGANGPMLEAMYDWVPGFASFRGLAKFTFPLMLFVVLAIAMGADAILRGRMPTRQFSVGVAVIGAALVAAGLWLMASPEHLGPWLERLPQSGETGLDPALVGNNQFTGSAGVHAGRSLLWAGALVTLVAAVLLAAVRRPALRLVPLAVVPLEALLFVGGSLESSNLADAVLPECRRMASETAGPDRVLNTIFPNNGFLLGRSDAGGSDPAVLRRYAEFITVSEGGSPGDASQHLPFTRLSPALAMLRVRFACVRQGDQIVILENATAPLPPVFLVHQYRVLPGRNAVLGELVRGDFDPRRVVLLEEAPDPAPSPGTAAGAARILSLTSDTLEVEVDTPEAAILVITDQFSRYWRARPADPGRGPRSRYTVLPANYVLRAVPLAPGRHHVLFEYRPPLLKTGAIVSVVALTLWMGLWIGKPASTNVGN